MGIMWSALIALEPDSLAQHCKYSVSFLKEMILTRWVDTWKILRKTDCQSIAYFCTVFGLAYCQQRMKLRWKKQMWKRTSMFCDICTHIQDHMRKRQMTVSKGAWNCKMYRLAPTRQTSVKVVVEGKDEDNDDDEGGWRILPTKSSKGV